MNKLLLLNEDIVKQAGETTLRPALPVSPKNKLLPILPAGAWDKTESRMQKTFDFTSTDDRNSFLYQVLGMESDKGHHALITTFENKVRLTLTTKSLNKVTELDKEYARAADLIYRDINDIRRA